MDLYRGVGTEEDLVSAWMVAETEEKHTEGEVLSYWLLQPVKVKKWSMSTFQQNQALSELMSIAFGVGAYWPPSYSFALVIPRNKLLAMAMFEEKDQGYCIWNACTHPKCRRQGYMSKILRAAKQIIKVEGKQKLYLKVEADNKGAIQLYQKHGFKLMKSGSVLDMEYTLH